MQPETLNLDKNGPKAQKVTESPEAFEVVKEDNSALISEAYLSRDDVSKDLTQPELYEQCTSMMDLDQEALSDEFDCKILFLEVGVNVDVTDDASLFAVTDDSVFQKAMFLYKKQKEDFRFEMSSSSGPSYYLCSSINKTSRVLLVGLCGRVVFYSQVVSILALTAYILTNLALQQGLMASCQLKQIYEIKDFLLTARRMHDPRRSKGPMMLSSSRFAAQSTSTLSVSMTKRRLIS